MSLEYTYEARVHNNVSLCNTSEDSKSRIRLPAHCLPPEQPLPTCAALQIVNYKNRSRAALGGYTLGQTVAAKLGPKRKEEATSSQARAYAERPNCVEGLEGPSRPKPRSHFTRCRHEHVLVRRFLRPLQDTADERGHSPSQVSLYAVYLRAAQRKIEYSKTRKNSKKKKKKHSCSQIGKSKN